MNHHHEHQPGVGDAPAVPPSGGTSSRTDNKAHPIDPHGSHRTVVTPAAAHSGHASHADHGGHDKHAGHDPEAFRRLFWLSFVLTVPVVAFSDMVQHWFGYSLSGIPGHQYVSSVLGIIVFAYGGSVFLKGGWDELRSRQPGMTLLISLAISVAFASSLASEAGLIELDFWWELAALITIMLLGHWLEMRALGMTRNALAALAALLPDEAELVEGELVRTVSIAGLAIGDIVLVRPGARVPADGIVDSGQADFDESMLTGESRAVLRTPGDRVAAGTVALGSSVRVRVGAVGGDTALAGIQRLVEQAQASQSRAQAIADRAAAALFYAALMAGMVTFAAWMALGEPAEAITRTVTVLVIACPHALGLAIPLVIAMSTEVAARHGVLVKDRLALERMRTVDVVLFDKTGTLTAGRPRVTGTWAAEGDETTLLQLAGSVEAESEHPLGRAIVEAARRVTTAFPVTAFVSDAGRGVGGTVDGSSVQVVGPRGLSERGLTAPHDGGLDLKRWQERGATVLYVLRDDRLLGALALEDEPRAESREAVEQLHAEGIRVAMVTGDARNVADATARDLGIDEVFAEVLPEDKAAQVVSLQQRGLRVAMVGDGVNDAPALAQADVGLAIGAGTDVAIQSAGVVLASDDPRGVVGVIRLSRASYRKMVQNLVWATGYNVAAIPLAAGAFAWAGFVLSPAVGAVLMSLSTVIVALNAQLLRRVQLGRLE